MPLIRETCRSCDKICHSLDDMMTRCVHKTVSSITQKARQRSAYQRPLSSYIHSYTHSTDTLQLRTGNLKLPIQRLRGRHGTILPNPFREFQRIRPWESDLYCTERPIPSSYAGQCTVLSSSPAGDFGVDCIKLEKSGFRLSSILGYLLRGQMGCRTGN